MKLNLLARIDQSGYGIHGLNVLKAATRADCEVALWPLGLRIVAPPPDQDVVRAALERTATFDPRAPCLRLAFPNDMTPMVGRGTHAGLTAFELDRLTDRERHHLGTVDVVLIPTRWGARVLRENGIDHVALAPHGVDRDLFNERRPSLTLPAPFVPPPAHTTVFLNVGKWERRKGHDVLCEAFNRAFSVHEDVLLMMNCHNPFIDEAGSRQWQQHYLTSPLGRANRILVFGGRWGGQDQLAALMHHADCGVFPARSEGWNLGLLEMMACGKHVICTDYAGHTGFATEQNARLVSVDELEEAVDGGFFHGQGRWARLGDSQLEQLMSHLRAIHRLKQEGGLGVNQAGIETAHRFSWDNCFARIRAALRSGQEQGQDPPADHPGQAESQADQPP
jgi:glycosyltransferase involved in cell wall biosynthesis